MRGWEMKNMYGNMKMTNFRSFLNYLIMMLVYSGCTEIDTPLISNETVILKAVIESDDGTKTVLGGEHNDQTRYVLWEPEDKIIVSRYDQSENFIFKNTLLDNSSSAYFEGEITKDDEYIAFYPSKMSPKYNGSTKILTFELPMLQNYAINSFGKGDYPMVAKQMDNSDELQFKNLCGVLGLNLVGKDTVTSIIFSAKDATGADKIVSGKMSVNMSQNTYSYMEQVAGRNRVVLDCGDGVPLDSIVPTTFYLVLPPNIYNSFTVTISNKSGRAMTQESSKYLEIKRSIITYAGTLNFVASDTSCTFLDVYDSANSYIVSGIGNYGFSPLMGNSYEKFSEIDSVEVLWESFGTSVSPDRGDLIKKVWVEDGNIIFSTADIFREGNAVIAAKDSNGDILWSWHIWMTDMPNENVYANHAGIMMDRNLGSTSSVPGEVEALGLLYQWGRKDPFLGSCYLDQNIVAASTLVWPDYVYSSKYVGTIDYARRNPTIFISANGTGENWLYLNDRTLWSSTEKTIYDPCPPGWLVPVGGDYAVWSKVGFSSGVFDDINKGFSFVYSSTLETWYPAAGYLSTSATLASVGSQGSYWSADAYDYYSYGYHYRAYNLQIGPSNTVSPSTMASRGCALSVRCMKE